MIVLLKWGQMWHIVPKRDTVTLEHEFLAQPISLLNCHIDKSMMDAMVWMKEKGWVIACINKSEISVKRRILWLCGIFLIIYVFVEAQY